MVNGDLLGHFIYLTVRNSKLIPSWPGNHVVIPSGCIAFVYIARSMETGDVRQCVLKGGDVSMMTKQTKQGFTAAKLPCLIAEGNGS